jgi:hypothetical protein
MINTGKQSSPARIALAWEARWIPVEMVGTGMGLLLGIGYDRWDAASACLFGVCIMSWIVRWHHYSRPVENGFLATH